MSGSLSFALNQVEEIKHTVYVDNWGVISQNHDVIPEVMEEMSAEFTERRLDLHPFSIHTDEARHLGARLDLKQMCSTLTRDRYQRVKCTPKAVLTRKRMSWKLLEVLIGHGTFAGLACRPRLSFFHCVYEFISQHYFERALVWESVKQELRAFIGGLIFGPSDWCRLAQTGDKDFIAARDSQGLRKGAVGAKGR